MCKPVWHNVKRANLMPFIYRQVGAVFPDPSSWCTMDRMTILDKIKEESGWLFIVSYEPRFYKPEFKKTVVAALWLPDFGGAGWVDLPKDGRVNGIVKGWDEALAHKAVRMEAEANNCMAL